jgi:hypothetical protein
MNTIVLAICDKPCIHKGMCRCLAQATWPPLCPITPANGSDVDSTASYIPICRRTDEPF